MVDSWFLFKQYWKEERLPTFFLKRVDNKFSISKFLALFSILGFLSLCFFAWYLHTQGVPYGAVSWDIHVITFLSFFFLIICNMMLFFPHIMYMWDLLSKNNSYYDKDWALIKNGWVSC